MGACLVDPFSTEDFTDECDVQADTEQVKIYKEFLCMACLNRVAWAEEINRSMNVDHRDDGFLKSEDDKLNTLIDVVNLEPHARIGLIATKCLDCGRHLKNAEVDNDHRKHCAQYALVSDNNV